MRQTNTTTIKFFTFDDPRQRMLGSHISHVASVRDAELQSDWMHGINTGSQWPDTRPDQLTVWRLLSHGREIGRSPQVFAGLAAARRDAISAVKSSDLLDGALVGSSFGGKGWTWYFALDQRPVLVSSRWFRESTIAQTYLLSAHRALSNAEVTASEKLMRREITGPLDVVPDALHECPPSELGDSCREGGMPGPAYLDRAFTGTTPMPGGTRHRSNILREKVNQW